MVRRSSIGILLVAFAVLLAAPSAVAEGRSFRAKPSGIVCVATRIGRPAATVRCDLPFQGRRAVFLHTRGKARIKRVSSFVHPRHPAALGRGQEARYGPFACRSLRSAVTCKAGNGHGFTVGRSFQLTF